MAQQEVYRTAVPPYPGELPKSNAPDGQAFDLYNNVHVSYGLPYNEACKKHVEETFHASRVYILSSTTLADKTPTLRDLETALEGKVVGTKKGLTAHTTWSDVLAIVQDCKRLDVDLIITLGGSTLSDAAKLAAIALANNVNTHDDFTSLPTTGSPFQPANSPTTPVLCIPTSLSAAEYTNAAGATDDRTLEKTQFLTGHSIKLIVLDAELVTKHTPPSLLLQSGIRAVDHSVEALCSTYGNAVSDEHATQGLKTLIPGLLRCYADKDAATDVEARHLCQMGVMDAIAALFRVYTPAGGSHAIGHILGPFGVGHGQTSCLLLPAVCAYNYRHGANVERQDAAAALLWSIPELRELAEEKGLRKESARLADLVDVLVRGIGMPRTLKEVGVGRDKFAKIAEFSIHDEWCRTNPVPLTQEAQVLEILESIAE